jgi:AcrR family transcriptional regulator
MIKSKSELQNGWQSHLDKLIVSAAKKTKNIEKKHQQIVKKASHVLFEKGYHPTSIREIAEASGMSLGQLYHYISSKDDLLFLIHKHMQTTWYDHLMNSGLDKIIDPKERLIQALQNTVEFLIENKKLIQFVYSESKYLDKKHLRVVLEMDNKNVVEYWRKLLEQVNEKEKISGDINFLANTITFLMVFIPLRGWNLKYRPTKELVNSLTEFILKGVGLTK